MDRSNSSLRTKVRVPTVHAHIDLGQRDCSKGMIVAVAAKTVPHLRRSHQGPTSRTGRWSRREAIAVGAGLFDRASSRARLTNTRA